jgi:hypothetical protein
MEYTHIIQPMILIGIFFGIGAVSGSFWMFCIMYRKEKRLEKELDSKNALLNTYINTYEDDGYEAY